jgi:acyl carrier protein
MNALSSDASVRDTVLDIVATQAKLDIAVVRPESTIKDLNIESLTAIEILFEIEEHYDIDFPDEATDLNTGTLQQLIDAVESTLAAKAAKAAKG